MKCKICNEPPKMIWKDKGHTTGHSEPLFANRNGESVCANCLTNEEVNSFRGLGDLNEERKANNTIEYNGYKVSLINGFYVFQGLLFKTLKKAKTCIDSTIQLKEKGLY